MPSLYEEKMRHFIAQHHIQAEHLSFQQSCRSVAEAARAVNAAPQDLVKSICMMDAQGSIIVAIVKGEDRVSLSRVAGAIGIAEPRMATPQEILEKTGYPRGGTPSFGYPATFLIDPRVFEKDVVYTGGGSENSLIKITPRELQRANNGQIKYIRE